ncbi:folliculin [Neocloeon triangulifer]|uniref:folliculin n=1 Tax=Neocloeon triangulifer TaxID=2078957 RepID=UPI00286F98AC|nr:folliculin [Neocloeon triangulifer]
MNAVITLNHFCEVHGPQVLFCTQSFHDPVPFSHTGTEPNIPQKSPNKRFYGNLELLRNIPGLIPLCEACRSLDQKISGLLSSDHEGRTSYLSGQNPTIPAICGLVKHACLRSLSCEISKVSKDDPEKPVFFGDSDRGHVLSVAFSIRDAQGRGFQRNYSICVLAVDAPMLLQSWPFLTKNIQTIISELQEMAIKVFNKEQEACPQRAVRINASAKSEENKCNKATRSLAELTDESLVYYQLHSWFVWLLKAGANRLQEKLTLPPFLRDIGHFGQGVETEEGFVLVPTSSSVTVKADTADHRGVLELEASGSLTYPIIGPTIPGGISELYTLMGRNQFLLAANSLLIGHQLIVQCDWPSLAYAVIESFKCLVTRAIFQPEYWSGSYFPPAACTLIGVSKIVQLPSPLPSNVVMVEITKVEPNAKPTNDNLKFTVKAPKAPTRWPTLLVKMDKALQNDFLTPTALHCHLVALKEEWLNISRTVMRLLQTGKSAGDLTPLMNTLGAQAQDWQLIKHWGVLHANNL